MNNLARELKILQNLRSAEVPILTVAPWMMPKGLVSVTGRVGNRKPNQDNPNYSVVVVG